MEKNENFPLFSEQSPAGRGDIPDHAPQHYYGDITRRLFMAGGVIMLLSMPFFSEFLDQMLTLSALATVTLALIAGFANPGSKSVQVLLLIISGLAVIFFESYAAYLYGVVPFEGRAFFFAAVTQILAIIFFLALYFSAKTVRWMSTRTR